MRTLPATARVALRVSVWLLALAPLLAAGCGRAATGPEASGSPGRIVLPGSPTELPAFDLVGFRTLLRQLRGTPVVVNVWASWCGPCTREAPGLANVAERYRGRVQFLGVDIQDNLADARAFVRRFGWPYPSVFDRPGAIRDGLGFIGQPVTVVYTAEGTQSHVFSGPVTEQQLSAQIERVLA